MTPEAETYEIESRVYQNPETSRNEQQQFYENLRAVQQANNAEIRTQTENLGTDVPSVQGGLIGPESYFTSRYQTPQTNQTIAELRSAAQASALNMALSNLQAQYKKQYEDAYRNYQKRASRGSSGSGGGSSTSSGQNTVTVGEVVEQATDQIAQPDEIMRRIEKQKQEEENAKKAGEYIEEVQQKTEQAINPPTTVLSPQEAVDYWKNLRR